MSDWGYVLEQPRPNGHYVKLYAFDRPLTESVGRYLVGSLKRGGSELVVASSDHNRAFCLEIARFGVDLGAALDERRLVLLDAREALTRIMNHGEPDRRRFQTTITDAIGRLRPARPGADAGVGVYGELVGILWTSGQYAAAMKLEAFWNELQRSMQFSLFCAYPVDVFGDQFRVSGVEALLCDHTNLLSSGDEGKLNQAIDLALEDVFGTNSTALRLSMTANYRPSWDKAPEAEGAILWIRKNLPDRAEQILHLARKHYLAGSPSGTINVAPDDSEPHPTKALARSAGS